MAILQLLLAKAIGLVQLILLRQVRGRLCSLFVALVKDGLTPRCWSADLKGFGWNFSVFLIEEADVLAVLFSIIDSDVISYLLVNVGLFDWIDLDLLGDCRIVTSIGLVIAGTMMEVTIDWGCTSSNQGPHFF